MSIPPLGLRNTHTVNAATIEGQAKMTGNDQELQQTIADEMLNAEMARLIYQARSAAELTQAELTELIGSRQPVIARLEDADYEGHSLSMLQRIAAAFHQPIKIHFVPVSETQEAA
jgi:ribosome-binding protein aMBF1 (putative translation factor)